MENLAKLPPQAVEMEVNVLGAMLIDREAVDVALSMLCAADFYLGKHKVIFEHSAALYAETQNLDQALLRARLEAAGALAEAGGAGYLTELLSAVPTSAHIADYAAIVKDRSITRQLIAVATDCVRDAFEPGQLARELAGAFSRRLTEVEERISGGGKGSFKDTVDSWHLRPDEEAPPLLYTGIAELDAKLGGINPGNLVVIAAPSSHGKTTLGTNIVTGWARDGMPVLIYSYEMSREEISQNIMSAVARACVNKRGKYNSTVAEDAARAAYPIVSALPIFVDDNGCDNISALAATARMFRRKESIGALMVDYIQLVPASSGRDTREQEVAEVSRALKRLARELSIPVIACSQLNDQGLMRESRAIKNDADILISIKAPAALDGVQVEVDLAIEKNRNGETGSAKATWQRGYRLFENLQLPAYREAYAGSKVEDARQDNPDEIQF